jgi:hypothetical protein
MSPDRTIEPAGGGPTGSRRAPAELLAAIRRLPGARVEPGEDPHSASVRVQGRAVARLDLERGEVVVYAPAVWARRLRRGLRSARLTDRGLVFCGRDRRGAAEALQAIEARIDLERFAGQYRYRSP